MPVLSDADIEQFLAEPGHLMRLASVDAEGAPHIVPLWYLFEDDALYFTPRARAAWLQNLKGDPRIAVSIDEEEPPNRKVTARGEAVEVFSVGHEAEWRDRYRRLAGRYLSKENVDRYIENTREEPRPLMKLVLADAVVTSWRLPQRGEGARNSWADRYYSSDSTFRED